MKRNLILVTALLAVFALFSLSACKSDAEKFIGYMEEMAEIIDSNKDDCDKMGDALAGFADDNAEDMKALQKKLKDLPEDEQKAMREKYEDRMEKAQEKMDGLGKCATNEKIGKAMEKLF
ncbi:MAG: hypothetical protein AUK47_17010 [Deltaproteobacteria bacterium CG2_30_63_29]|nr:MAG: hypothetical protein AUK47_17010 [Deltaproteobacteria bacterium CG2_30_63_29]PIW00948.1 MAG: hypothetical protein COW42_06380 [Deltaproteobacteria bacterium CG17_big_fil_post_rev_8_21_14_2_50_63_7]PJB39360.1 MAG: hypothetical protein CO108_17420 [Deltaproteobacteria bacterium CG_4_9_14_3_um_filter_63_12]